MSYPRGTSRIEKVRGNQIRKALRKHASRLWTEEPHRKAHAKKDKLQCDFPGKFGKELHILGPPNFSKVNINLCHF